MSLNILPELDTVLHRITKSLEIMKFFCEKTQGVKYEEGEEKLFPDPFEKPFPIPFIDNLDGDSPLELALRKKEDSDDEDEAKKPENDQPDQLKQLVDEIERTDEKSK